MTSIPIFDHPDELIDYAIKFEMFPNDTLGQHELTSEQSPSALKIEFDNIQREIEMYEKYFERGMVDNLVLREVKFKYAKRLHYLAPKLAADIARDNRLREKMEIKNELRELFSRQIMYYSIAKLDMDSDEWNCMVVPEIFKMKTREWFEDFEYLSSESPLGKAILCSEVGTNGSYTSPNGAEVAFYIKSTQIAPLETLKVISDSFGKIVDSHWVNHYPQSSHVYNNYVLPPGNGGERRKDQLRP